MQRYNTPQMYCVTYFTDVGGGLRWVSLDAARNPLYLLYCTLFSPVPVESVMAQEDQCGARDPLVFRGHGNLLGRV